jgi:hypothetical protein
MPIQFQVLMAERLPGRAIRFQPISFAGLVCDIWHNVRLGDALRRVLCLSAFPPEKSSHPAR